MPLSGLNGAMNLSPLRAHPNANGAGPIQTISYDLFGLGQPEALTIDAISVITDLTQINGRVRPVLVLQESGAVVSPETTRYRFGLTLPSNFNPTGWVAPGMVLWSRVTGLVGALDLTIALSATGGAGNAFSHIVSRTVVAPDGNYVSLTLPDTTLNAAAADFQPGDLMNVWFHVTLQGVGATYQVRISELEMYWTGTTP